LQDASSIQKVIKIELPKTNSSLSSFFMRKRNEVKFCRLNIGSGSAKRFLALLVAVTSLSLSQAWAGTDMKGITPPAVGDVSPKDWTIELGSGCLFSNVRVTTPRSYTLVPINLTASLKLDDVSLDNFMGGWLRGYTEFYFNGGYFDIVSGPETRFAGVMVGPRYNFVQPGWKVIPFLSGGVGLGFANSAPQLGGFGQDFNFSFECSAGAKYLISDDWFLRLAVEYKHISNAGMSEPTNNNNPVDALGPQLTVGYAF
jgi:opacity protein-like surface antigen